MGQKTTASCEKLRHNIVEHGYEERGACVKKSHGCLTSFSYVLESIMLILLAMSLITNTLEPILNTPNFTKKIVDEGKQWSELALLSITKLRATFNLKLLKLAQF